MSDADPFLQKKVLTTRQNKFMVKADISCVYKLFEPRKKSRSYAEESLLQLNYHKAWLDHRFSKASMGEI